MASISALRRNNRGSGVSPSSERDASLTEEGRRHARRRAGGRGGFVVAGRGGLLLDGAGSFAVHAAGLAFEDRRFAGVLEGTGRRVVELYPMLKNEPYIYIFFLSINRRW